MQLEMSVDRQVKKNSNLIQLSKGPHSSTAFREACREVLNTKIPNKNYTFAQGIAMVLGRAALTGDIAAIRELAERAEGKVSSSVEVIEKKDLTSPKKVIS